MKETWFSHVSYYYHQGVEAARHYRSKNHHAVKGQQNAQRIGSVNLQKRTKTLKLVMQWIAIGMDIVTVKLIVDFEYMTRIIMPLYTLFQKQFYF